MSLTQVISLKTPEISTVNRDTGSRENGITIFETVILQALEFMGIEWKPIQIRESAEMLYAEYYWMTLAELKHFTLKLKQSEFECQKEYGEMKPRHLLVAAREYSCMCLDARESQDFLRKRDALIAEPTHDKDGKPIVWVDPEKVSNFLKDFKMGIVSEIEKEQQEALQQSQERAKKDIEGYAAINGIDLNDVQADINQPKKAS